ncbi:MAG: hypothetical protein LLF83_07630 [Methanobacterium sp.]|nr:hypothetical protein [Methanobacterium sp.]
MQLAMRYPDLVRKIVFSGGPSYHPDGFYTEFLESDKMMKPGKPWKDYYDNIAPNPSDLSVVPQKIKEMTHAWEGVSDVDLKSLKAPALLIIGDSDIVRLDHVVDMFKILGGGLPGDLVGIPNSQLAVFPGTTHTSLLKRADCLISMIMEFFDSPMPK